MQALKKIVKGTAIEQPLRQVYGHYKSYQMRETVAVVEFLDKLISEMEQKDPSCSHRFHIKRYQTTLNFLPNKKGKLLDLGCAHGLFDEVLNRFRKYDTELADHFEKENSITYDFETDTFPYQDASFDVVLFMEVLEHLREDPMHALSEINRILKQDGLLLLSTPNIASWRAIQRALNHENPALFPIYLRNGGTDRHNREYTFNEVSQLAIDAGFEIVRAEAIDVYDHLPFPQAIDGYSLANRGDTTFILCKKVSAVKNRKPNWLYWPSIG